VRWLQARIEPTNRKKQAALRLLALLLCALYLAVTLLSAAYLLAHVNHVHDNSGPGGACATCLHIASAKTLLKTLSSAVAAVGVAFSAFAFVLRLRPRYRLAGGGSPVTLKVRMNN
jgi:hypothetical protein